MAQLEFRRQTQHGIFTPGHKRYDGLVQSDPSNPGQPGAVDIPKQPPLGLCRMPWVDPDTVLPAALIHPAFGLFTDEAGSRETMIEQEDCDMVAKLVMNGEGGMPYMHTTEAKYQTILLTAFNKYFGGIDVYPSAATISGKAKVAKSTGTRTYSQYITDGLAKDPILQRPHFILVR